MNTRDKIGIGLAAVIVSFDMYTQGMERTNEYLNSHSPGIQNKEQLQRQVEYEKEKLRCNRKIIPSFVPEEGGRSHKDPYFPPAYVLEVGGNYATDVIVKHEVYHICRGDLDAPSTSTAERAFKYTFSGEPAAILYSAFDIRL